MRFLKFLETFSEDFKYIPTKDEVRHFSRISNGYKPDYSKDRHNVVLKTLYNLTLKISDEKTRNKFSETIFRNMGDLSTLLKKIEKLNEESLRNNMKIELAKYIQTIKESD
jgi:hypothetical protein